MVGSFHAPAGGAPNGWGCENGSPSGLLVELVLDGVDGLVALLLDLRAGLVHLALALETVVVRQVAGGFLRPALRLVCLVAHDNLLLSIRRSAYPPDLRPKPRSGGVQLEPHGRRRPFAYAP